MHVKENYQSGEQAMSCHGDDDGAMDCALDEPEDERPSSLVLVNFDSLSHRAGSGTFWASGVWFLQMEL